MTLAILFMSYLLLALTLMAIGLHRAFDLTPSQRTAVIWWAWFWPYMIVRAGVKRIL